MSNVEIQAYLSFCEVKLNFTFSSSGLHRCSSILNCVSLQENAKVKQAIVNKTTPRKGALVIMVPLFLKAFSPTNQVFDRFKGATPTRTDAFPVRPNPFYIMDDQANQVEEHKSP